MSPTYGLEPMPALSGSKELDEISTMLLQRQRGSRADRNDECGDPFSLAEPTL
jgi:hypothetical protein